MELSPVCIPVVKTEVQMFGLKCLLLVTLKNECTQGSFLNRMHTRVFLDTNAPNQKRHFDGCTQQTFRQRMRARYGAIPGVAGNSFSHSLRENLQCWNSNHNLPKNEGVLLRYLARLYYKSKETKGPQGSGEP